MKHTKKFNITYDDVDDNFTIAIRLNNDKDVFTVEDISSLGMFLGFPEEPFDHVYGAYDLAIYQKNEDYYFTLFAFDELNELRLSITYQNELARKRVYEVIDAMKQVESGSDFIK